MRKLILILAALVLAAPALGQTNDDRVVPRPRPGTTAAATSSNPLINALVNWTDDDLTAASALATAVPELQDPVGKACWDTLKPIGLVIKQHPLPATLKLATDIQAARLIHMALRQACAKPECTQVWQDFQTGINALLPLPLPFQMASVCSKIP